MTHRYALRRAALLLSLVITAVPDERWFLSFGRMESDASFGAWRRKPALRIALSGRSVGRTLDGAWG